jgi:RHS repeat-associated protein
VPQGDDEYSDYLIDSYNHTGYTKVIEETIDDGSPETITYTIGDDVISQHSASVGAEHLLYDGHGSTRQLTDNDGTNVVVDSFGYDAYGVLLGGNPTRSSPAATSLLYTGEYYDNDMMQYNLRARWYDTLNGRFNQLDPYAGNIQDPQSLHKYLYAHCDPVNNIDPSGLMEFSLQCMFMAAVITGLFVGLIVGVTTGIVEKSVQKGLNAFVRWFWVGFAAGLIVYAGIWFIHTLWVFLTGGLIYGNLQYADRFGIRPYSELTRILKGNELGLQAHHIIPERFASLLNMSSGDMFAVAAKYPEEHQTFTNMWRTLIPYGLGTANATKQVVWEAAQQIYAEYPALWETAKAMLGIKGS